MRYLLVILLASIAIYLLFELLRPSYTSGRVDRHAEDLVAIQRLVVVCGDLDRAALAAAGKLDVHTVSEIYFEWTKGHGSQYVMDINRRILIDYWGRDIFVLSIEGAFWGLASSGKNGVWEGGRGDDIIVSRDANGEWNAIISPTIQIRQ